MTIEGCRVLVRGVVQGVGFRPFVYRVAHDRYLAGSVRNLGDASVEIVVEDPSQTVQSFLAALRTEPSPLSRINDIDVSRSEPTGSSEFVILPSTQKGSGSGQLPPNIAACDACVSEILGSSRFLGYRATSCTNWGPRFTVIESKSVCRQNSLREGSTLSLRRVRADSWMLWPPDSAFAGFGLTEENPPCVWKRLQSKVALM